MGAFLSQPVTEKVSEDGSSDCLRYGASSMQGWRMAQEDAHNCELQLTDQCALFAVYDGHGGCEVARYTAAQLPPLLLHNRHLRAGHVRRALRHVFRRHDAALTRPEVVQRLKAIACDADSLPHQSDDEAEAEEVDELYHEAHMPLDQLMSRYTAAPSDGQNEKLDEQKTPPPPTKSRVRELRRGAQKPLSPFLRGKQHVTSASGSSKSSTTSSESGDKNGVSTAEEQQEKSLAKETSDQNGHKNGEGEDEVSEEKQEVSSEVKEVTVEKKEVSDVKKEVSLEKKEESSVPAAANGNGHGDVDQESAEKNGDQLEKSEQSAKVKQEDEDIKTEKLDASGDAEKDAAGVVSSDIKANGDSESPKESPNGTNGDDGKCSDSSATSPPVKQRLKGPHPGSDKLPLVPDQSNTPASPSTGHESKSAAAKTASSVASGGGGKKRALPHRAAAEVYRGVLESARLAREAGLDEDGKTAQENDDDDAEDDDEDDDEDFDADSGMVDTDQDLSQDVEEDDDQEQDGDVEDEADLEDGEDSDDDEDEEDSEDLDDEEESGDENNDFMVGMKNEPGSDSGCTAAVSLLYGRHLYVANIGDSRCVLCRDGLALDMSQDHKPEDEPEQRRIELAGGKVTEDGRVNGGLNLSRAFGDHAYKTNASLPPSQQMISACPDISHVRLDPATDQFLVVACDGIWNSMSSQQVVDFVSERLAKKSDDKNDVKLSKICEELFDECLAPDTRGDGTGCDNMTCIIVQLRPALAELTLSPSAEDEQEQAEDESDGESDGEEQAAVAASSSDGGAPPRAKRELADEAESSESPKQKRARAE